jgi:hypothetical protein
LASLILRSQTSARWPSGKEVPLFTTPLFAAQDAHARHTERVVDPKGRLNQLNGPAETLTSGPANWKLRLTAFSNQGQIDVRPKVFDRK